ncbi:MAG: cation transporter [bacterium]|nr:MAG: cation transporter [bacterium]
MRYSRCVVCYEIVGWVGLGVSLALSTLKVFVGMVSGSQALVADAMYSIKDVITSILIIIGLKVSKKPIDKEHPYGHGKIEFILSGIISVAFIGITSILFFYAAESLLEGEHKAPHMIALWTALFSVIVNVSMYSYTRCASYEINSPMVRTLSRHHRAEIISSAAVAFAIVGSHYLGMPWLDPMVALFETLHLLYLGGEIFWDSFKGLMDSSAPEEVVEQIKSGARSVSGVKDIEKLRTRRVGQDLWVDLTIGVDPELSVRDAKSVGIGVEETLVKTINHLGNVNVRFKSLRGSVPELDVLRGKKGGRYKKTSKTATVLKEV